MAYGPSKKLHRFGESHPPNLIPIMNLFLVLIPMLITMTVSVKLAIMQLNLPSKPGQGKDLAAEKPKELELTLALTEKEGILLSGYKEGITKENMFLMGKGKNAMKLIKIPNKNNKFDLHTLEYYIKDIKKNYKDQKQISFACDMTIKYEDLIKAMDLCRRNGLTELGIVEIGTFYVE